MGFHTNEEQNLGHREDRALRGFFLCALCVLGG